MKFFLLNTVILILILAGCRSIFLPVRQSNMDFLPRETDIPGWTIKKSSVGEYCEKIPGLEDSIQRVYVNEGGSEILCLVLEFSTELSSYGYFSLLRGYGRCSGKNCNTSFVSDTTALRLYGKRLLIFRKDWAGPGSEFFLPFLNAVRVKQEEIDFKEKIPELAILDFNSNYIVFNKLADNSIESIDNVFHTRVKEAVFFISRRPGDRAAFDLYSSIVNRGNYSVLNSDSEHISINRDSAGIIKYIGVKGLWLFGGMNFKSISEVSESLDTLKSRLK